MASASQSGKLREFGGERWVDEDTVDPINVFGAMARLGTSGSSSEQGLGATYTALETLRDTYNNGFLRDESDIHVVVLSDERDQTPGNLITGDEFVDWFDNLRPDADATTFSSIVTLNGYNRGSEYIEVTEQVGGVVHESPTPTTPCSWRIWVYRRPA